MKWFHFLGSLTFAVILIACAAAFVIAGTVLESLSGSHLYASQFTYGSPAFALLLCGFFINILFSALRRFPFKRRHVGFLATHLGLLLIIAGTLIKNTWGVQGMMGVMEGSGSDQILLPGTLALHVETKEGVSLVPLRRHPLRGYHADVTPANVPFSLSLLGISPHCEEKLQLWFKGHYAQVRGLPPFPVHEFYTDPGDEPLPVSMKAPLGEVDTLFYAFISPHGETLWRKTYESLARVRLTDPATSSLIHEGPLDADTPIGPLHLHLSLAEGEAQVEGEGFTLPLTGDKALILQGELPYRLDIQSPTALFLLKEPSGLERVCTLSRHGRVTYHAYDPSEITSMILYDEGYGGYGVGELLDHLALPHDTAHQERALLQQVGFQLRQEELTLEGLSPPLALLKAACDGSGEDFVEVLLTYYWEWRKTGQPLFPADRPLPSFVQKALSTVDWSSLQVEGNPAHIYSVLLRLYGLDFATITEQATPKLVDSYRASLLSKEVRALLNAPDDASEYQVALMLQKVAPGSLKASVIATLFQELLPQESPEDLAALYLRSATLGKTALTGYHPSLLKPVALECPLTHTLPEVEKLVKQEENRPKATLKIATGGSEEIISLPFDRYGVGLKWPALGGKALLRFQPMKKTIPHRLRLREARQVNYPGTQQAFSYESDVLVGDEETTLSMNQVHETRDGYRFYMANVHPPEEGAVKQVQIVVNRDPVRYLLTYPGALIMALGILILFWGHRLYSL